MCVPCTRCAIRRLKSEPLERLALYLLTRTRLLYRAPATTTTGSALVAPVRPSSSSLLLLLVDGARTLHSKSNSIKSKFFSLAAPYSQRHFIETLILISS